MELFKTPSNLPFLHYTFTEIDDLGPWGEGKKKSMSIRFGAMPIMEQPSIDDLWTTVDNSNISNKSDQSRISSAIILCGQVAHKSWRACANILIVPNEAEKEFYDVKWTEHKLAPQLTVIVDPSLEPNELRATWWKILYKKDRIGDDVVTFSDVPIAVDGGIQISPEGFSAIQKSDKVDMDYHGYFRRGFM